MQACPGCGTTTEERGQFCPACGGVLTGALPAHGDLADHDSRSAATARLTSAEPPAAPRSAPAAAQPASPPDTAASLIGRTIGDFAIDAVIGGGSFGKVYRGRQLGLDRPVAVKVPTYEIAADPIAARRFAREARATARIVHPGVVAIYAVGELDDGRPYLAMQLIDGEPLDRILGGGPVPALRALRIARDVASALSETHAAGVVHRDLKPTNIMWRRDRNGDDRITLVDFGIAVCKPGNADATRLTANGVIGTPHYMSPEQVHGDHVDGRADLYALGCVMFELTTGTTPFAGSGFEVLLEHLGRPPPRASDRAPEVPEIVDRLIAHLMAKLPDDRPANADAVVAMIDDAIAELDGGRPPRSAGARATTRSGSAGAADSQDRTLRLAVASEVIELDTPRRPRVELREIAAPDDAEADPPRRASRRWLALAAAGALALSAAGFAALRWRAGDAGADEPEPAETATGKLISPSGVPLRLIARDDGELIIRTFIPEVIHAGVRIRAHLEITTKLGGRFSAKQVVITIEDPHHNATAQTAVARPERPGHYGFSHSFAEPGDYVVRIFPSETETVSTIDLAVVP